MIFLLYVRILRLPFDCDNLLQYLAVVMLEYVVTRYTFVVVAAGASFGVGAYLFAVSISDDIKSILKSMNNDAKSKRNSSKALKHISNYIQVQAVLKQLSYKDLHLGLVLILLVTIFQIYTRLCRDNSAHSYCCLYMEFDHNMRNYVNISSGIS